MRAEALLGVRDPNIIDIDSPLGNQQEVDFEEENQFPTNNAEFIDQLVNGKSLIEKVEDAALFYLDVQRGLTELARLAPAYSALKPDLPRGSGKIVLIPGFASPKLICKPAVMFFRAQGFSPEIYMPESLEEDRGLAKWIPPVSILGSLINIRPVAHTIEHFMDYLSKLDGKVTAIGHSKGGLLLFAAYATHRDEFVDKVGHMVFVGSPRPRKVNTFMGWPYVFSQVAFNGEDFKFGHEILSNADIKNIDGVISTAIGDPKDSILDGEMIGQIEDQISVSTSHTGELWNIDVLAPILTRVVELKAA